MAAQKTNTNDAPKFLTVSQIAVMRAEKTGRPTDRCAKEVRSRLRSGFEKILAIQPDVANVKTAANDGNRWPTLSIDVVDALNLTGTRKPDAE